jgi:hypothetical protein
MGLFDQFANLNPEQTQGLLAAAAQLLQAGGPSRTPVGFGQALGAGLQGYQQGSDAYRTRQMQEQQAAQIAKLTGLKISDAESDLANQEQMRADAAKAQAILSARYQPQTNTSRAQSVLGENLAPTVDNAAILSAAPTPAGGSPDQYTQLMGDAQALRQAGLHKQADATMIEALKFKPEFSQTPQIGNGPDGKPALYVLDKNGTAKFLSGVSPQAKLRELNLGGITQLVDDNTITPGQIFTRTQTPDSLASNAIARERLSFDKSQADTNQDAPLDPLAVRMTAQQYLAGDSSALQNYGRGAQGAKNLNLVRQEIARQATDAGLNGADIAAKMAEFQGVKAGQRTAGTRSANIEIAANEAAQLAPLALEASAKVARSGFLPFGKAEIMFNSNTNDPNLRQFAMANNALVNAFGQVMSRGGAATVSDKEHARELLSTAFDQPSYAAAVAQLNKEIEAARKAPGAVRKDLREAVSGRGETVPNPMQSPSQYSVTAPNGKTYTFPDAKSLANFKLTTGIK